MSTNEKIPGVRNIIAMSSGKGGVGKSTASVNLALALSQMGLRVGISDIDIFGPSIPVMMGVSPDEKPMLNEAQKIIPLERHGLKIMSMGMLMSSETPAIFRGPMVTKFLQQLIMGVEWGELDYLILDLPPGTGDTQLSLAQSIPLNGAIVITTPQDVSCNVALRGARMFEKVRVPILGIVENLSHWVCEKCGHASDIFSTGGGRRLSEMVNAPFLGGVPIDPAVVLGGDRGEPIVVSAPHSPVTRAYQKIAKNLLEQIDDVAACSPLRSFTWIVSHGKDDSPGWNEQYVSEDGDPIKPVGLKITDERQVAILWANGTQHHFDFRGLRLACPCAHCVDENTGEKLLQPSMVPIDVQPFVIESVGAYALRFTWSDGHGTGIYSFENLRRMGDAGLVN